MINRNHIILISFLYFLGFFKAKNHAYLGAINETNLIKVNFSGDEVFDKEQAELAVDIQNPLIKNESIDFPKDESETVIENNDYIHKPWSIFHTLGDFYTWAPYNRLEKSIIY